MPRQGSKGKPLASVRWGKAVCDHIPTYPVAVRERIELARPQRQENRTTTAAGQYCTTAVPLYRYWYRYCSLQLGKHYRSGSYEL